MMNVLATCLQFVNRFKLQWVLLFSFLLLLMLLYFIFFIIVHSASWANEVNEKYIEKKDNANARTVESVEWFLRTKYVNANNYKETDFRTKSKTNWNKIGISIKIASTFLCCTDIIWNFRIKLESMIQHLKHQTPWISKNIWSE